MVVFAMWTTPRRSNIFGDFAQEGRMVVTLREPVCFTHDSVRAVAHGYRPITDLVIQVRLSRFQNDLAQSGASWIGIAARRRRIQLLLTQWKLNRGRGLLLSMPLLVYVSDFKAELCLRAQVTEVVFALQGRRPCQHRERNQIEKSKWSATKHSTTIFIG